MAAELEQEELSPEEQFVKEKVDSLLEKVGAGHGESMQLELADRLEKTTNEFHEDAAEMIASLKAKSEERRGELKTMWANRDDEQPDGEELETTEEETADSSDWEKRLETKAESAGEKPKKEAKSEHKGEEKPKKKKFGFFKRKKKEKE